MNRTPSVGTPFLDKLSVTIPVPQDYWIEATDNFFELSHIDSRLSLRRERYDSTKFKLYNFSWTFRTSTAAQIVHIQILPKKSNISYMRIEWNPSKTGSGIFRYLMNFLAAHIPQLEASARRTLITRADIAVDVTGLRIGDIYAFSKSARTTQNSYFDGPNRSLSGMYLGTKKSAKQLLIYDKNLKEYGEDAVVVRSSSGRQWKRLVRPRTRIELRIHNLGDLVSHHTLSNQFEGYSLVDARTVKTQQGRRFSAEFCANCEKYGAQLALSQYEPRVRARLRKFLDAECALPWYRPADWWLAGMTEIQRELGPDPINARNAS